MLRSARLAKRNGACYYPTRELAGPLVSKEREGREEGSLKCASAGVLCVRLGAPYFFSSERSSKMMGNAVALLGMAVACGPGGAAAQVSTVDLCPFCC
eukprot:COSAG02_NODE_5633_length_4170_cov_2.964628_4_plen_98_part_00